MQVFNLKKLGCNVQLSVFESSTGTYTNYQIDSSNFELIFNAQSKKVGFTITGEDSFTTLDITLNNVLYFNPAGTDVLINSEAALLTNYPLIFAC
jgi:hypothetical protein